MGLSTSACIAAPTIDGRQSGKLFSVNERGVRNPLFEYSYKVVVVVVAYGRRYFGYGQVGFNQKIFCFFYSQIVDEPVYGFARKFFYYLIKRFFRYSEHSAQAFHAYFFRAMLLKIYHVFILKQRSVGV